MSFGTTLCSRRLDLFALEFPVLDWAERLTAIQLMQYFNSPRSECFPERALPVYTCLDRYNGALAVVVDNRNIKPGPPLQQFRGALHNALRRRQSDENR